VRYKLTVYKCKACIVSTQTLQHTDEYSISSFAGD